jgi:hypothetical protein
MIPLGIANGGLGDDRGCLEFRRFLAGRRPGRESGETKIADESDGSREQGRWRMGESENWRRWSRLRLPLLSPEKRRVPSSSVEDAAQVRTIASS